MSARSWLPRASHTETFYFHFPTKEHVLLELECGEEARMATELARFLQGRPALAAALTKVVSLVAGLEQRLGPHLFKELLAFHFSPSRPLKDEWTDHPVIVLLVDEIELAEVTVESIRKSTRSTARCSSCSASTEC